MAIRLTPYLNFDGTTREAMEFYRDVLGGELRISTFGEYGAPGGTDPEGVMHASLETPTGLTLMASDMPMGMPVEHGNDFSVSLSGDDAAELTGYWEKLSAGGRVDMALAPQPWGDTFGMCVDRFGTSWMVNISDGDQESAQRG